MKWHNSDSWKVFNFLFPDYKYELDPKIHPKPKENDEDSDEYEYEERDE